MTEPVPPAAPAPIIVDAGEPLTVRATSDEARADAWSLVLHSASIEHELARLGGGFALRVAAIDYEQAERALAAYDDESVAFEAERRAHVEDEARAEREEHSRGAAIGGGLAVVALLAAFFFVTGGRAPGSPWFQIGTSSAERVLAGEWWRTITALTLHAGSGHLLSNAVGTAVLVSALFGRMGVGLGGALLLASGAGGNWLNAAVHGSHHASVGFSTAIFGAVGILGGLEFVRRRLGARRLGAWVALAASLALLGLLGSDKESDGLAHLFGFLAGAALGAGAGALRLRVRSFAGQAALATGALLAVAASWWLAGAGALGRLH